MRNYFVDYFCFTRGERNGTFILVTIMVLVYLFPIGYTKLRGPAEYRADPEFIEQIEAFYGLAEDRGKISQHTGITDTFLLSSDDTMEETDFRRGDYYPETGLRNRDPQLTGIRIEINMADTTELMKIRGIGPVFSRRIVGYRDLLGGYYDVRQLLEVYGMDKERFIETEPFVYADSSLVSRIRPTTDEFRSLLRHPYLDYKQVSEIFRLRRNNGLNSLGDLLSSPAFSASDIEKLAPYLEFE